jgi:hypothetical protein
LGAGDYLQVLLRNAIYALLNVVIKLPPYL